MIDLKRIIPYIFVAFITVMLIAFPKDSLSYALSSLEICKSVIIPTLFPFFVCSGLLIYSGVAQFLAKLSGPLMKPLFNVGGPGASALVLGILGGYPLGAVTACQLYESGYLSQTETERLLAFCNNSGPLFILGAVGSAIYSSGMVGVVLYASHIISTLFIGFIFRFYKKDKHTAPVYRINQQEDSFPQVFSKVLSNSINSILTVCGAIVFFGVVSGVITAYFPDGSVIKALISGILELSGGTFAIEKTDLPIAFKLSLSAACIGFAGMCVHLQVASVTAKHHLSLVPYITGKILHGLFSAILTFLYFAINSESISVFKNNERALSAGFCMSSLYSVMNLILFLGLGIFIFFSLRLGFKAYQLKKE